MWNVKIPSKTSFFAWRLIRDRLRTKSNLRRRNIEINDSFCPFFRNNEEDAAHLFFNCSKILPVWWESVSWSNISGVFPQTPRHHFLQHGFGRPSGVRSQRWQIWWIALSWSIWQHRNGIIFSNDSFNGSKLMEDATFLCWSWFKNLEKGFEISFNHWSSNLREGFCNQGRDTYIGFG